MLTKGPLSNYLQECMYVCISCSTAPLQALLVACGKSQSCRGKVIKPVSLWVPGTATEEKSNNDTVAIKEGNKIRTSKCVCVCVCAKIESRTVIYMQRKQTSYKIGLIAYAQILIYVYVCLHFVANKWMRKSGSLWGAPRSNSHDPSVKFASALPS